MTNRTHQSRQTSAPGAAAAVRVSAALYYYAGTARAGPIRMR